MWLVDRCRHVKMHRVASSFGHEPTPSPIPHLPSPAYHETKPKPTFTTPHQLNPANTTMSTRSSSGSESPAGRNSVRLPAYEPPILPLHQRAMPQLTQDSLEITRKDNDLLDRAREFLASSASQLGQRSHFATTEKDEMARILEGLDKSAKRMVDHRQKVKDRETVMATIVSEEERRPRLPEPPEELAPATVEEGVWGRYSEGVKKHQKAWDELPDFEK